MSTKDLIERLNRTKPRTARPGAAAPGATQTTQTGEVQTRVGDGVIRRRRVEGKERGKDPAATRSQLMNMGRSSEPREEQAEDAGQSRVTRRRTAADLPPAPVASPPEPPTAAEVASANILEEKPSQASPEAVAAADEGTPEAAPIAAAAAEGEEIAATAREQAARQSVEAHPVTPEPEAAVQHEVEAASSARDPSEPAITEPVPEPSTGAPQPEPVVEAAPPVVAEREAPSPEPVERPERVEKDEGQASARSIASSLPRADGSRPNLPNEAGRRPLPGLGAGVIAPPPGYDPSNPQAFHQRVRQQQAEEQARQEREREAQAREKVWRDERAAGGAAAAGRGPEPGRRDRRGPAGAMAPAAPTTGKPAKRRRGRQDRIDMMGGEAAGAAAAIPRRRRTKRAGMKKASPKPAAHKRRIEMADTITVADLAHGMSIKAGQVIKKLIGMGQMATLNDVLDLETAQLVAAEFDYEVVDVAFQEDEHLIDVEDTDEDMEPRPPVVTIMGHVDHGKTTLLDAIRSANVAAGEAGGITQHISAYQVEQKGQLITFIDTPGHAAFTAMRARGAQVTDIVVLVVAADDGVMPQTVEVINHAKAAGVEILVALNKIDKPDAQPQKVRQQLMEHELVPEEYGGDTIIVETSALKGKGVPELLDAILLVAELQEYGANPDRHAEGTVIEGRMERGKGAVATVLVQHGTLKPGDTVVVGTTWGRVRALTDTTGRKLKEAGPSTPVEIMGLAEVPNAGDNLVVVANDKDAKSLVEHRLEQARLASLTTGRSVSLEDLLARQKEGELIALNLIVKADVGGSLEALRGALEQIEVEGADIKILHSGVGAVTESDVTLAHTNDAVILAFNVRPDAPARRAIDGYGVEVRTYSVIYEALEDVEKALRGLLAPETKEVVQGTAEIRQTFAVPKVGTIAGCMVTEGKIARNFDVRLLRDGKIVWTGRLGSLRRFKDDVREVVQGYECGMNLDGFNDIKVGDVIEAFSQEQVGAAS